MKNFSEFVFEGVTCEIKHGFGWRELWYDGIRVARFEVLDLDNISHYEMIHGHMLPIPKAEPDESLDACLNTTHGIYHLLYLCHHHNLHLERLGQRWSGNGKWRD